MLGSAIDSLIMFAGGAYAALGYPKAVAKRVAAGTAAEQETNRVSWMRPLGYILMLIAVVLLFVG